MKLIIEDDEGRKTVVPVVRDEISIGRNDGNLVKLTEKNVSRSHARLLRQDGGFYIEDLESFTGVRVNGERVKGKQRVGEGDLIQISEYDLLLQDAPTETKRLPQDGGDEIPIEDDEVARASARAEADAEARARKNAETAVIRLSDLGKMAPAEDPPLEIPLGQQPKLVGIQGAFRGKELVLHKSPVTIGRSEDNDLELDHPSVSRRQCRLHLDNRTWKVLDAESKNGVRVNGEPYAAIGLRHGDVLEIGHLKFAFVAPGHVYKPPSDGPHVAMPRVNAGPSRSGLYLGIAAAVVLIAGLGAFFGLRHGKEDDETVEVGADAKAERRFALKAAEAAARGHRYAEAVRNYEIARRSGATPAELRELTQVQVEARAEELYREMESAAASQDWERARKLLDGLTGSKAWYGGKAAEKAEAIAAGYVNLHVAAAALMKGKDNAGCVVEAQLALQANPRSADARSLLDACKSPQAARSAGPQVAASSVASRPASAGQENEARRLVKEGNDKLVARDFKSALPLLQKALALRPGPAVLPGLYRSLGIAYTSQGDVQQGAKYYRLYLPLCTNPAEKAQLQKVLDDYERRSR